MSWHILSFSSLVQRPLSHPDGSQHLAKSVWAQRVAVPWDEGQQISGLPQILTFTLADSWCPKQKVALAWLALGIRIILVECKHLFSGSWNPLTNRCCPMVDTLPCAPLSGTAQCWSDGNFSCSKQKKEAAKSTIQKSRSKWHWKACLTLSRW